MKKKIMAFNQPHDVQIETQDGSSLKEVKDFKYLWHVCRTQRPTLEQERPWHGKLLTSEQHLEVQRNKEHRGETFSGYSGRVSYFIDSETWTVTNKIVKSFDGCFTRMLRKALDVNWNTNLP